MRRRSLPKEQIIMCRLVLILLQRFCNGTSKRIVCQDFVGLASHNLFVIYLFIIPQRPGRLNVQLPRIPNTESIVKRSPGQRSKEAATGRSKPVIRRSPNPQPQAIKPQLAQAKVLQSLLRRFPSALAEINKRLISQNLLWFTINDRTNTQRLEIPKPNVWRQFSETV